MRLTHNSIESSLSQKRLGRATKLLRNSFHEAMTEARALCPGHEERACPGPDKESPMKKLLLAVAALPYMASAATAGQPLTDRQMDKVTAGFSAVARADAEGLVGALQTLVTTTSVVAQVRPFATASQGGITSTLILAVSGSHSSSVTSTTPPGPVPGP
jgi:hypothetical protein